jgi:hypothetical protein
MKRNMGFILLITMMLGVSGFLFYQRFWGSGSELPLLRRDSIAKQLLRDARGQMLSMQRVIDSEYRYWLIAKLNDCSTCLFKGLDEVRQLGTRQAVVVLVSDWFEDALGWSKIQPGIDFFYTDSRGLNELFLLKHTPTLLTLKRGRVVGERLILP